MGGYGDGCQSLWIAFDVHYVFRIYVHHFMSVLWSTFNIEIYLIASN
jgi:hypothetical protein